MMREAARLSTVSEADVAASFLVARGIHAVVADRHLTSVKPILATALGGVRILTRSSDLELAQKLLAEVSAREPSRAEIEVGQVSAGDWIFRVVTAMSALIVGGGYAGSSFRRSGGRLDWIQIAGLILLTVIIAVGIAATLFQRTS
jgi:hypothetical protein